MTDQIPPVPTVVVAIDAQEAFRRVIVAPTVPVHEKFTDREIALQERVAFATGAMTGVR